MTKNNYLLLTSDDISSLIFILCLIYYIYNMCMSDPLSFLYILLFVYIGFIVYALYSYLSAKRRIDNSYTTIRTIIEPVEIKRKETIDEVDFQIPFNHPQDTSIINDENEEKLSISSKSRSKRNLLKKINSMNKELNDTKAEIKKLRQLVSKNNSESKDIWTSKFNFTQPILFDNKNTLGDFGKKYVEIKDQNNESNTEKENEEIKEDIEMEQDKKDKNFDELLEEGLNELINENYEVIS